MKQDNSTTVVTSTPLMTPLPYCTVREPDFRVIAAIAYDAGEKGFVAVSFILASTVERQADRDHGSDNYLPHLSESPRPQGGASLKTKTTPTVPALFSVHGGDGCIF